MTTEDRDAKKAARLEAIQAKRRRIQAEGVPTPTVVVKGGNSPIRLAGREIRVGFKSRPLKGVVAEAVPAGSGRTTASRVAVGTLVLPVIGTAIGAMAKKKQHVLVITGPGWSETVVFKDLGELSLAARTINDAAK